LGDRAISILAGRPTQIDVTTAFLDHVKVPWEVWRLCVQDYNLVSDANIECSRAFVRALLHSNTDVPFLKFLAYFYINARSRRSSHTCDFSSARLDRLNAKPRYPISLLPSVKTFGGGVKRKLGN